MVIAGLSAGVLFAGYRIEELVGRGGMGVIYRATESRPERTVALKVVAPELAADSQFRDRFLHESQIAASIEHPHVVPVSRVGEENGVLFIAMRFIQGMDLAALIAQEGRLEPLRATKLIDQIADALDTAHEQGLVHRDVKPANVLVEHRRRGDHAYLTDFGLTKSLATNGRLTGTGMAVGTTDYMAPEQFEGGRLDARVDVYSLGCVLFETLTGRIPYAQGGQAARIYAHFTAPPPTVSNLVPGISRKFDEVVRRALAKNPDDRYPSVGDLSFAALAAAEGRTVHRAERSVAAGGAAPSQSGNTDARSIVAPQADLELPTAQPKVVLEPSLAQPEAACEPSIAPPQAAPEFNRDHEADPSDAGGSSAPGFTTVATPDRKAAPANVEPARPPTRDETEATASGKIASPAASTIASPGRAFLPATERSRESDAEDAADPTDAAPALGGDAKRPGRSAAGADTPRRPPRVPSGQPRRGRRWLVAAVIGAAAAVFGLVTVISSGGPATPRTASAGPIKLTAKSGPLAIPYSPPWHVSPADLVGVFSTNAHASHAGGRQTTPITLASGAVTLAAGLLADSAAIPADPPPKLVSRYGRPGASSSVDLAGHQGREYTWSPSGQRVIAYVIPATVGDFAVACSGAAGSTGLEACGRLAQKAALSGARPMAPGPDGSLGSAIARRLRPVSRAAASLTGADGALSTRAGAANGLATAAKTAAGNLAGLALPPRYQPMIHALKETLLNQSHTARQLGAAAARQQRTAYARTRAATIAASRTLAGAVSALRAAHLATPNLRPLALAGLPALPKPRSQPASGVTPSTPAPTYTSPSSTTTSPSYTPPAATTPSYTKPAAPSKPSSVEPAKPLS